MKKLLTTSLFLIFLLACSLPSAVATESVSVDQATATPITPPAQPATDTLVPTLAPPTETFTPIPPTETSTPTAIPFVDSLKAKVTSDKLVCRLPLWTGRELPIFDRLQQDHAVTSYRPCRRK